MHEKLVLQLWNSEFPVAIRYDKLSDFQSYLQGLTNARHILLMDDQHTITAWLATFDRENERWFVMLIERGYQGKGFGSQLLDRAKADFKSLNGWAVDHDNEVREDGSTYPSPLPFYEKHGFKIHSDHRLQHEPISAVHIYYSNEE